MCKQAVRELTAKTGRKRAQRPICLLEGQGIINAKAVGVQDVVVGKDVGWRACNHCRFQTGLVTVLHEIECSVTGTDNGNRLGN
jgi:hypothetical protein